MPRIYMLLVLGFDGSFCMKNFCQFALFLFILKLICCLSQTVDVLLLVFISCTAKTKTKTKKGRRKFLVLLVIQNFCEFHIELFSQ